MRWRRRHSGPPGQTVYYRGWGGVSMPRVPQDPLPAEEARDLTSHYRARYDDRGRMVSFTKILNGKSVWEDSYLYWDGGNLRRRVMSRADGPTLVEDYDTRGRLVSDSQGRPGTAEGH